MLGINAAITVTRPSHNLAIGNRAVVDLDSKHIPPNQHRVRRNFRSQAQASRRAVDLVPGLLRSEQSARASIAIDPACDAEPLVASCSGLSVSTRFSGDIESRPFTALIPKLPTAEVRLSTPDATGRGRQEFCSAMRFHALL
jgi:hypothetical protein